MGTGESCEISLKKGQVLRYSNNILAGKWQIKSNCPRGLDMSRAEQIFVCTHIIQVLCITQRALHFISFQMFCSALVSLCIDVYFSHTYHSQFCPLSHSQSLCNSPGMLPKSLSSVQSPVRMWDSPLSFISTHRKQPWKRTYGIIWWSPPNDKTRHIIFSSRKLFFMFLGISLSRSFWSCVCTWTHRVTLSRGRCSGRAWG